MPGCVQLAGDGRLRLPRSGHLEHLLDDRDLRRARRQRAGAVSPSRTRTGAAHRSTRPAAADTATPRFVRSDFAFESACARSPYSAPKTSGHLAAQVLGHGLDAVATLEPVDDVLDEVRSVDHRRRERSRSDCERRASTAAVAVPAAARSFARTSPAPRLLAERRLVLVGLGRLDDVPALRRLRDVPAAHDLVGRSSSRRPWWTWPRR